MTSLMLSSLEVVLASVSLYLLCDLCDHSLQVPEKYVLTLHFLKCFFGPPGTGKSLVAQTMAKQIKCSFVDVSILMSSWQSKMNIQSSKI